MGRLVVLSPNWLGDAVMALPALADLRRMHAGDELHVAARAGIAGLFRHVPGVDRVLPLSGKGGSSAIASWRADAATLAAGSYDTGILLPNSFASALLLWTARVPKRIGVAADGRSMLLTRAVPRPRNGGHQAQYYQQIVTALGGAPGLSIAHLEVTEELRDRATRLLSSAGVPWPGSFVVLAPGAAYGTAKQWPPERWAELANALATDGITCVLVGSGADRAVCARVSQQSRARSSGSALRVIDLAGRTDLEELIGILAVAAACVSNDSGAMHLAAAAGAPVVAIFGPTDERRTSPLPGSSTAAPAQVLSADVFCRPCMLRECPIDHRCMTRISASEVAERVKQGLRV